MTIPAIHNDPSSAPVVAAILGVFCFAVLDATLKSLSTALPTSEVAFFRFAAGSLFAGAAFLRSRQSWPPRDTVVATLVRAAVTVATVFTFVYALSVLPLANAVVLTYSAPLFMALLGRLLLGERVTRRAALALAIGFSGIFVTFAGRLSVPDQPELVLGSASAVLSGALYALSMVLARLRSNRDTIEFTVFGQNIFATAMVLPFIVTGWQVPPPSLLGSFVLVGFTAVVAQFLMVWAFMRTVATRVAPIEYSSILWAGIFGYILFGERPTWATLAGAVLVAASGLLVATARSVPIENG